MTHRPSLCSLAAIALCALLAAQPAPASDAAEVTAAKSACGNGHLDAGETCATCPGDCVVHSCAATGKPLTFDVDFDPPPEMSVSSITVLVGYDSGRVALPGKAGDESVTQRISNRQDKAIVVTNDLDYALRAVYTRPGGIEAGRLFTLSVDGCGKTAPALADLGCTIEGCAAASGHVAGCSCHVTAH